MDAEEKSMRQTNGHEEWKAAMDKAQELLEEGQREMAKAKKKAKTPGTPPARRAAKRGTKSERTV